jgi:hypothetical protein
MEGKNFFGPHPFFKRVFSLVFVPFLVLGALAFMGCPMEGDGGEDLPSLEFLKADSSLVGTWEFTGDYATEAYIITADTIKYGFGSGTEFSSEFEARIYAVQYFTGAKDSGMLYIEYTTKKPQYYSGSYGPAPDYEYTQTGGPFDPPGNFIVIMFHELKTENGKTTIKLANPYNASDTHTAKGSDGSTDVEFIASEVSTLAAAREKFNIDTENDFLYSGWSGVSAQTKINP